MPGALMQAELEALEAALGGCSGRRPPPIGGAKVSSKLEVLGHVLDRVDVLIIGGGMANTFLNAKGVEVGKSLCEHDLADAAREIMAKARPRTSDHPARRCGRGEGAGGECRDPHDPRGEVGDADMILDVGPKSAEALGRGLDRCRTLLWNGPLGLRDPALRCRDQRGGAEGRRADPGGQLQRSPAVATPWRPWPRGRLEDFTYVSTAGGAFLEWLEGKELPGVAALRPK